MPFDNKLLHYFVRDSLSTYSESLRISGSRNPVMINLNRAEYSLHLSYVHDSGENRDNDDEVRIQIGRTLIEQQRELSKRSVNTAFIGFFPTGRVFVAWDPRHVYSLQAQNVVSVYARRSLHELALNNKAAVHSFHARLLAEDSNAIALPTTALGLYLENIECFHRLNDESSIVALMKRSGDALSDFQIARRGEVELILEEGKEKFKYTRSAFPRNPNFKNSVMNAYGEACCICGRQLGIIEAAHIIPHCFPESTDEVKNGLALCVEHHRLYDSALLLPGPKQRLIFNQKRADFLRQMNQGKGLKAVENMHGNQYRIPAKPKLQPSDEYLENGVFIRIGE